MDIKPILTDLKVELNRLNQAIAALESLDGTATATTPTAIAAPKRGGRRRISAAGRKRISEAAKARWAARRKGATKLQSNKKTGAHKPMSAATKKRLSLLAKRRWAARKKAAKAS
jgi:hypothetical protein